MISDLIVLLTNKQQECPVFKSQPHMNMRAHESVDKNSAGELKHKPTGHTSFYTQHTCVHFDFVPDVLWDVELAVSPL